MKSLKNKVLTLVLGGAKIPLCLRYEDFQFIGVKRMQLDELKKAEHVTGIKQVTKAINKEQVACVFLGANAEGRVTDSLKILCEDKEIPVEAAYTMEELGKACSIGVKAAAVAVLKQGHC
jgi:large subunit ribosomal protein L7A